MNFVVYASVGEFETHEEAVKFAETFEESGESTIIKELIHTQEREEIRKRLEELRKVLRAENISYGELSELQSLKRYIESGDVELLEAAGVPEFPEEKEGE